MVLIELKTGFHSAPLHKTRPIKNFIKAVERDGRKFLYLKGNFDRKKSNIKLKADIFIVSQIRGLLLDNRSRDKLNPLGFNHSTDFSMISQRLRLC